VCKHSSCWWCPWLITAQGLTEYSVSSWSWSSCLVDWRRNGKGTRFSPAAVWKGVRKRWNYDQMLSLWALIFYCWLRAKEQNAVTGYLVMIVSRNFAPPRTMSSLWRIASGPIKERPGTPPSTWRPWSFTSRCRGGSFWDCSTFRCHHHHHHTFSKIPLPKVNNVLLTRFSSRQN
jgi:hypothetical protein